ncbi:MAG: ribonuclease J, partial [Bacillota bacterium]|nr:ribonuclease J [Bacillota bacterium]
MPLQPNRRKSRLAPRRKDAVTDKIVAADIDRQPDKAATAAVTPVRAEPGRKRPATAGTTRRTRRTPAAKQTAPAVRQAAPAVRQAVPAAKQTAPVEPKKARTGIRSPLTKQAASGQKKPESSKTPILKVIPLGGMREIGKNLTVYEYGDEMIIVDCGIAFPEDDMPGIDVVIPDFSYVIQNKHKLKAIFLTHGHEDHIGALPWLCKDIRVPIYGNQLTIELVRLKLEDRNTGASNVLLKPAKDGDLIRAGAFSVEFIHVNHSIADANAFVIRTPVGVIYHSGDFKIDYTPITGNPMDLSRIAAVGNENVLLLLCESTNVERKGNSSS